MLNINTSYLGWKRELVLTHCHFNNRVRKKRLFSYSLMHPLHRANSNLCSPKVSPHPAYQALYSCCIVNVVMYILRTYYILQSFLCCFVIVLSPICTSFRYVKKAKKIKILLLETKNFRFANFF